MTTARFYWLKHDAALAQGDKALAGAWKTKALAAELDETPLPADVPARPALVTAHFTLGDLVDVDLDDLTSAGLSDREARAVLTFLSPA